MRSADSIATSLLTIKMSEINKVIHIILLKLSDHSLLC